MLDVRIVHQVVYLYFIVEVTDVANDCLVFHLAHVADGDDIAVSGGSNEDITFFDRFFHRCNFESFHSSLQSTNRVDFSNQHTCSVRTHGVCTTFTHVTVSGNYHDFTGNHHVGSTFDTVGQRFAAAIQVVEFGFCYRIVHIDGRNQQFAFFHHLVQTVYAGRCLFGNAFHLCNRTMPTLVIFFQDAV